MWLRYAFNKLVRAILVDFEKHDKKMVISYKTLSDEEYSKELINKFHEEALEVIASRDKKELIEEIGDCYEVIDEILRVNNITKKEVIDIQQAKRSKKGSFDRKHFINYMEFDQGSENAEWFANYVANSNGRYKELVAFDKHIVDFIIFNDTKDKIFIQKSSQTRQNYPNVWELPGGTLEVKETFSGCIKRELKEELNLELLQIKDIIYESSYNYQGKSYAYTVFAIEVTGWENFKLKDGKAEEYRWILENEIDILKINRESASQNVVYDAVKYWFNLQN